VSDTGGARTASRAKVAAAQSEQWNNQSPCQDWTARAAFRSARADIKAVLDDPELAATPCDTPMGSMAAEANIDGVVSEDMVIHGWDLARATDQDDTIDPDEVERMWPSVQTIGPELRTPGAFGHGIVVFGPEVKVSADAPLQDRVLGLLGRDPVDW